jgi:carbamoyltransferase
MRILGISAFYHDSAAALIVDGKVVSAQEEERFTGEKHDQRFPINSIKWILKQNKLKINQIDKIVWYEDPKKKYERFKEQWFKYFPKTIGLTKKLIFWRKNNNIEDIIRTQLGYKGSIEYVEHHISHLAYSFYTSPFNEAHLFSVDGVGENETAILGLGLKGRYIQPLERTYFPHSLGLLYASITAFLGFKPNSGEYKVMGLVAYGNQKDLYREQFEKIAKLNGNTLELDMKYFSYHYSEKGMFTSKMAELFNVAPRTPESELEPVYMDIAFSLQAHYERLFFKMLNNFYTHYPQDNLCLSGGCAYNGLANGKITIETPYKNVYVPPAPSDAGSAIGCALFVYYQSNPTYKRVENSNPFLGPSYGAADFITAIAKLVPKEKVKRFENYNPLIEKVADLINDGAIIGWFQDGSEFGQRALGHRSILANPTIKDIKPKVNRVIKKREGFRPFAPMVTADDANKYFEMLGQEVPYMNQVFKVKDSFIAGLPSITHADKTARVQTVRSTFNPYIFSLLKKFEKLSGYPILLNTSFNLRGQTMVLDPTTAIKTFYDCEMDYLVLGNYLISK